MPLSGKIVDRAWFRSALLESSRKAKMEGVHLVGTFANSGFSEQKRQSIGTECLKACRGFPPLLCKTPPRLFYTNLGEIARERGCRGGVWARGGKYAAALARL